MDNRTKSDGGNALKAEETFHTSTHADGSGPLPEQMNALSDVSSAASRYAGALSDGAIGNALRDASIVMREINALAPVFREMKQHKAVENALAGFGAAGENSEWAQSLVGLDKNIKNALSPLQQLAEANHLGDLQKRMSDLQKAVGQESALGKIARNISAQKGMIDRLGNVLREEELVSATSRPLDIPLIENPIHETNKRLGRIEQQFEQVAQIASDSAQIALGLQAAAAEFLQKFERAADDTNRSGAKAIRVGWLALAIAVITSLAQIVSPLVIPDNDAVALREEIAGLQAAVAELSSQQLDASERMISAIATGDERTVLALKEALTALNATLADQEANASSGND